MEQPAHSGFSKSHGQLLAVVMGLALVFACGGAYLLEESQTRGMRKTMESALQDIEKEYEYKNASGSYLAGKIAAHSGDIKTALVHLGETMAYQQSDERLLAQAYRLSVLTGNFEQAEAYAGKMQADVENNLLDPELLRAVLAIKQGKYALADKMLEELTPRGAHALFLPIMKNWVALGMHEALDVKALEDGVRFSGQFEPLLRYQLALLLDAAGMEEKAETYYSKVADGTELSYRMASILANFYQRQGDAKKLRILQEKYEQQYGHGLGPVSDQPLVSTPREGAAEIFYGISSVLFGLEAYSEAQVPLQLALYLRSDFDSVRLLRANLLEQQEKYDEAYAAYEGLEHHPAFGLQAGIRRAYCLHNTGKTEEALALLEEVRQRFAGESEPVLTIADILRVEKRYKEAAELYGRGLEMLKDEKGKQWSVLYARGICQERVGDWPKAEADFLEALRLEPDQPDVLNYLGYSWLIQHKHLLRAREMIEKAMAARPQDAHIIDSMGWAMYQLGNYEEALDYLEQAADLSPRDPTVNEHLGDVYWRLGYEIQARYQWERALFFKPEEPGQEEHLRTKLSKGLPALPPVKEAEMLSQNAAGQGKAPFVAENAVQTK